METPKIFRIDPGQPADAKKGARPADDDAAFRRVLERLEELSRSQEPDKVDTTDDLLEAVRKADEDFLKVMDLRKELERAYRSKS